MEVGLRHVEQTQGERRVDDVREREEKKVKTTQVRASPAGVPAGRWRRTAWDAPPAPLAPPFAAGASALARVAPARDAARDLRLVWPLPSIRRKWRTRPCDLAAHCLGHEGPKSALAQLRR